MLWWTTWGHGVPSHCYEVHLRFSVPSDRPRYLYKLVSVFRLSSKKGLHSRDYGFGDFPPDTFCFKHFFKVIILHRLFYFFVLWRRSMKRECGSVVAIELVKFSTPYREPKLWCDTTMTTRLPLTWASTPVSDLCYMYTRNKQYSWCTN